MIFLISHNYCMMFRFSFVFTLFFLAATSTNAQVVLQTRQFKIGLSKEGRLTELTSPATGMNYLPAGQNACLLCIKSGNKMIAPDAMLTNYKLLNP